MSEHYNRHKSNPSEDDHSALSVTKATGGWYERRNSLSGDRVHKHTGGQSDVMTECIIMFRTDSVKIMELHDEGS